MSTSPRTRLGAFTIVSAASLLLVAACADSRVRQLTEGISKDSAFKILGQGAPKGDSLPNMYKHGQYLAGGTLYDVYFFDPQNREAWVDASVPDEDLTPVVFAGNKLQGWGWSFMDELTEKHNIQVRRPEPQK